MAGISTVMWGMIPTAETYTFDIESIHIIGILMGIGKFNRTGHWLAFLILSGGTIKTPGIAYPVDKKTGPASVTALVTSGRKIMGI